MTDHKRTFMLSNFFFLHIFTVFCRDAMAIVEVETAAGRNLRDRGGEGSMC